MNPLVSGLFQDFRRAHELEALPENDAFELFSAQLLLGEALTDQLDLTDLLVDKGALGLDVVAIELNGQLVFDSDDVHDIAESAKKIDVALHLIQAKRSASVDSTQILGFGDAAERFLTNEGLKQSPLLKERAEALQTVFSNYAARLKARPSASLSFVTSASQAATSDENVLLRLHAVQAKLEGLQFLGDVRVQALGTDDIHYLWTRLSQGNEVELQFQRQINLPKMPGVDQAILGLVSASELLKLVTDSDGNLQERVFYDNVRGFQGMDNLVNRSILDTLESQDRDLVPVLNNGVTVVARSYAPKPGDNVSLSDFQIVNGCQTSHCLYLARDDLGDKADDVFVPLRLVVTSDEDVANRIIRATNWQTPVTENDLVALTRFQKQLEDFYRLDPLDIKLTYERRPGQFFGKPVTKTRVVTIFDQMRSVSSVFLDVPHSAARYASKLYGDVGHMIFRPDHTLLPYLASAFAAYRLENAFRTGLDTKYKSARYHILMAFKFTVLGKPSSPMNSKGAEEESTKLIGELKKPGHVDLFRNAVREVERAGGGELPTADRLKRQRFTFELRDHLLGERG